MSCTHASADLGLECSYCSQVWVKSDPSKWTKAEMRTFARSLGYRSQGFADGLHWFAKGEIGSVINVGVTSEDIANGDAIYMLANELTRVP